MNQYTTCPQSLMVNIIMYIILSNNYRSCKTCACLFLCKACTFKSLCLFSSVLFYWTLFFPTLGGAAILLIAAMFAGYGGLICGFLFPWLARSIFTQYHRMTTYQRFDRTLEDVKGTFHCCHDSVETLSVFVPGYPTQSIWEHLLLACSIPCYASMEK